MKRIEDIKAAMKVRTCDGTFCTTNVIATVNFSYAVKVDKRTTLVYDDAIHHAKEGLLRSIFGDSQREFLNKIRELELCVAPVSVEKYQRYTELLKELRELSRYHLPVDESSTS